MDKKDYTIINNAKILYLNSGILLRNAKKNTIKH